MNKFLEKKQDFINLSILISIALLVGIYLIATTVMISKDGACYIERAQELASNPFTIIKKYPPGYPFLIFSAQKFVSLFSNNTSVFSWIYSAQFMTLLCRLLSIVPLYFMGKLLVGSKNSFWGLLILILLPHSAKYVCDVLREWPYILFLACGFYFLLWGSKTGKWWVFGLVGLCSGLGYLIRHESIQLFLYGLSWIVISFLRPKLWGISRWKNLSALLLLMVGFAISAGPYMKYADKVIPPRLIHFMRSVSSNTSDDVIHPAKLPNLSSNHNRAELIPCNVCKSLYEILITIGENLMWFFLPPLIIGLYYSFRNNRNFKEIFFLASFASVNIAIMILRYCYSEQAISKRWTLPLIAFTISYIPVGLGIIGSWLDTNSSKNIQKKDLVKKRFSWFIALYLIGIGICMPKLLRPVRIEKKGYSDAIEWLNKNTEATDIIAVEDRRLYFYAERKGLVYVEKIPRQANYVARIEKTEDQKLDKAFMESYSCWTNRDKKNKKIVIYKRP